MPTVYLSPSTQEFNPSIIGNSEEYYMNLIVDAMIPYLRSSGIKYVRNDRNKSRDESIKESNELMPDLHLAIHSNAAPESESGERTGAEVFYKANSKYGKIAADIIAKNYRKIYPNKVTVIPTTTLSELIKVHAPAVLLETAYHDNIEDATWIVNNINNIAKNLVESLTEYFGIPFVNPQPVQKGIVNVGNSVLNIRKFPSIKSKVLAKLHNNTVVNVYGKAGNWYVVGYNDIIGYALDDFIKIV